MRSQREGAVSRSGQLISITMTSMPLSKEY
jgi:hypothetical protein